MTLHTYPDVIQGTDEWHNLRRGIVTASTIGQLITPKTLKLASNDTSRALTQTLIAERITGWTEPVYVSTDMMRGTLDEPVARDLYSTHHAPVTETGFMVRDDWGYRIGYSPDGLVGDDGLIEIKSRRAKSQLMTILSGGVPLSNVAQIQCGLLVSGRKWCDYVSFCGGMPLYVSRVHPDERWFNAIHEAVAEFEDIARDLIADYRLAADGLPPTERPNHDLEMVI